MPPIRLPLANSGGQVAVNDSTHRPPDPVLAQLGHAAALVRVRNLEGISGTRHTGPQGR